MFKSIIQACKPCESSLNPKTTEVTDYRNKEHLLSPMSGNLMPISTSGLQKSVKQYHE